MWARFDGIIKFYGVEPLAKLFYGKKGYFHLVYAPSLLFPFLLFVI